MKCAIDKVTSQPHLLKNMGRIGLVTNQTSTSSHYIPATEIIYKSVNSTTGSKITAVFGPQHGYWQTEQDNMKETPHGDFEFYDGLKVPLFSLYSNERSPTKEQLENIDTLVVDLQDIGCRVYTYMLTLAGCLRSASKYGKSVVVLDRSNPLGLCYLNSETKKWMRTEGNLLQSIFHSFVGWYEIPMRHGLTMGELGHVFIKKDNLQCDYKVILVDGLNRKFPLDNNIIMPWTMPSPNIPNFMSAFLFPAFVNLEGTNISEGRGTTLPFQLIGAPWLKSRECMHFLKKNKSFFTNNAHQKSFVMREHDFRPTFNKYAGEICRGIQFHIENLENINLFKLSLYFLYFCKSNHPKEFKWAKPGYEYNFEEKPINLIFGTDVITNYLDSKELSLENKLDLENFEKLATKLNEEAQGFIQENTSCFLYV